MLLPKAMRIDMLHSGIKVHNWPGAAETEFSLVRFKNDKEAADNVYKGYTPYADDIAHIISFVLSLPIMCVSMIWSLLVKRKHLPHNSIKSCNLNSYIL